MASAFVLAAASMTAVRCAPYRSARSYQRHGPIQFKPGNFGHVPGVRRVNERGLHWNISRARLRILRKPSDAFLPSVFSLCHYEVDLALRKVALMR